MQTRIQRKPSNAIRYNGFIQKTLDWEAGLTLLKEVDASKLNQFLEEMKQDYIGRKNYKEAAKILTSMSTYTKKEYITLLVEKGDDFRSLKKIPFQTSDDDQDILQAIVLPKLDLQSEIMITDYTKKCQDIGSKKARLKTVQDLKRDNLFVVVD